jgi:hypothetical protein
MNFDPSGSSNRVLVVHGNTGQGAPLAELGMSVVGDYVVSVVFAAS